MKSSFLTTVMIGVLISSAAFGQSNKTSSPVSKTNSAASTPSTASSTPENNGKTSFQRFSDRLKIGYFSAYQSSSLGQWGIGANDEYGVLDKSYTHNLFNQISFNYNFGGKLNLVINPRWSINTGTTKYYAPDNKGMFAVEDMLVGFQGTIVTSADKKFNWWIRGGARLPTSKGSREQNITFQPETYSQFTYDFSTKWQLAAYVQNRHWITEERFNFYHYRIYVAPYIQYSFNDTTRVQFYLENYSENRNRLMSINQSKPVFKNYWSNIMIALSKDITPKLQFMPFLGYQLNVGSAPKGSPTARYAIQQRPLDPAWLGFWLSYQIK